MNKKAILNENNEVVLEQDLVKWENWMLKANQVVGYDVIKKEPEVCVFTCFLGIAHDFNGITYWFKTITFYTKSNKTNWVTFHDTWDQAEAGHKKMVKMQNDVCGMVSIIESLEFMDLPTVPNEDSV